MWLADREGSEEERYFEEAARVEGILAGRVRGV